MIVVADSVVQEGNKFMVVNDIAAIVQTRFGKIAICPKDEFINAEPVIFTAEELTMMLALYSSIVREKIGDRNNVNQQ